MKIYTYKDIDGILRPRAFVSFEDEIQYREKDVKAMLKDGGEIVLCELTEIK